MEISSTWFVFFLVVSFIGGTWSGLWYQYDKDQKTVDRFAESLPIEYEEYFTAGMQQGAVKGFEDGFSLATKFYVCVFTEMQKLDENTPEIEKELTRRCQHILNDENAPYSCDIPTKPKPLNEYSTASNPVV